jgi:hypothetical protein
MVLLIIAVMGIQTMALVVSYGIGHCPWHGSRPQNTKGSSGMPTEWCFGTVSDPRDLEIMFNSMSILLFRTPNGSRMRTPEPGFQTPKQQRAIRNAMANMA